jgi:hypothetical protein
VGALNFGWFALRVLATQIAALARPRRRSRMFTPSHEFPFASYPQSPVLQHFVPVPNAERAA